MATQILPVAAGVVDSNDQLLAAGTLVALKGAKNAARVNVFVKDDANNYQPLGELTAIAPSKTLTGAGTYRFSRVGTADETTCGVFSA